MNAHRTPNPKSKENDYINFPAVFSSPDVKSYLTDLDLSVTACPAQEPLSLQVLRRMEGRV